MNLSNKDPTKCINQMAAQKNLSPISRETLLARTFNNLENFLNIIERGLYERQIFDLYHRYWLHDKQIVQVKSIDGKVQEGNIVSLDDNGFLLVELKNNLATVHPDGNSFDMLQGLIIPKN